VEQFDIDVGGDIRDKGGDVASGGEPAGHRGV